MVVVNGNVMVKAITPFMLAPSASKVSVLSVV